MIPLIQQIESHPHYQELLMAADDAPNIIKAICLIIPESEEHPITLTALNRADDESWAEIYGESNLKPTLDITYGAGFTFTYEGEVPYTMANLSHRAETFQRIESLNYSFGRYPRYTPLQRLRHDKTNKKGQHILSIEDRVIKPEDDYRMVMERKDGWERIITSKAFYIDEDHYSLDIEITEVNERTFRIGFFSDDSTY